MEEMHREIIQFKPRFNSWLFYRIIIQNKVYDMIGNEEMISQLNRFFPLINNLTYQKYISKQI